MQRALGDIQAKHFTELDGTDRFALINYWFNGDMLPAPPDQTMSGFSVRPWPMQVPRCQTRFALGTGATSVVFLTTTDSS
jgi:hypothetical protein